MHSIRVFLFLIFTLAFTGLVQAERAPATNEIEFNKINKLYVKGDYLNALKYIKALIARMEAAGAYDNIELGRACYMKAKIDARYGKFDDFRSDIDKAEGIVKKAGDQNPKEYLRCLLEGAEAYSAASEYLMAEQMMEKVRDYMVNKKLEDSATLFHISVNMAKVKYYQGYYMTAAQYIPKLMNQASKRIVKKELQPDSKGVMRMKPVPADVLAERKRVYADLGNLLGEIYLENGNYKKADSVVLATYTWIKKNLSSKDISAVNNLVLQGRLLQEKKDAMGAHKKFIMAEKLLRKTKYIRYKPTSYEAMNVYRYVLPSFKEVKAESKGIRMKKLVETRIKRYYGKENIYYGRLRTTDAEKALIANNWSKAEEIIRELLYSSIIYPKNHIEKIHLMNMLEKVYINTDRYEQAEQILKESVEMEKILVGENAPVYHMQLLDLANYQVLYTDNFREAMPVYENSLDKVVKKELAHTHKKYLTYLIEEAQLYELLDEFSTSEKILQEVADEVIKLYGITGVEYAGILYRQAEIDMFLGYYAKAEKRLTTSLDIYNEKGKIEDYNERANALEVMARFYTLQGLYAEARAILKKANKYLRRSGQDFNTSVVSEQLATLYILLGKYNETEEMLNQSITVKSKRFGVMHRSLIVPLNQMGHLYLDTDEYIKAEKMAQRSSEISTKIFGPNSIRNAESLTLLENIYSKIGDYQRAEAIGIKVLDIYTSQFGDNHVVVARAKSELAVSKFHNGKANAEVATLFNEALTIVSKTLGSDVPEYANILVQAAEYYIEINNLDKADEYLQKAEKIYAAKMGGSDIKSADVLFLRGKVASGKKKYNDALTFYTRSRDIYRAQFSDEHSSYLKSMSHMGQMYYVLGNNREAIEILNQTTAKYLEYVKKYFPGLTEREKTKFWNQIRQDFEFYNTMAIQLKDQYPELIGKVYNFTLATKALLLSSSVKVKERILNSGDPILVAEYNKWVHKREELTASLSMSAELRAENGIDIGALQKEIENLEKNLGEKSELFAETYESRITYDWKAVRETLKDNEYAMEIIRFRYFTNHFTDTIYYAALIVGRETTTGPKLVLFKNGKEMETKYDKYYRNSIRSKSADHYSYKIFWKDIREQIKDNATVYLSPDGVYNRVNLEAIMTPEGKYVIQQTKIVTVSNTKDLIVNAYKKNKKGDKPQQVTNQTVALFGNPVYYADANNNGLPRPISQLPGAEREVQDLNTLLNSNSKNAQLFLQKDATEEKVKKMKSPTVVHFATHGFFLEDINVTEAENEVGDEAAAQNPLLRSGLLMYNGGTLIANNNPYEFNSEDGILTAYEAMNLDLDNTELVVLSACETGLGKVESGEGVYGLQRAFLVAGANTIVMSLFKVNDEVTLELMTNFYRGWLKTGNKRQAFIDAKIAIMEKYKDPIYWGSFVMIGLE